MPGSHFKGMTPHASVWFIQIYLNSYMKTEVNPQDTNRAEAFELWMSSPMPMVTLTKTFDVSNLIKVSRRLGVKFNALLCW